MPAEVATGMGIAVNTSRTSKAAKVSALTKPRLIVGFDAVPKGPNVATKCEPLVPPMPSRWFPRAKERVLKKPLQRVKRRHWS